VLSRSFNSGRVASTYLFSGHEGLGHWPLAVWFAALLNCEKPVRDDDDQALSGPCGDCNRCRMMFALSDPGFLPIVPIPSHKNSDEAIDLTNEALESKRKEPFKRLTSATQITIPISMAREVKKSLTRRAEAGVTRVVLFYQMEKMLQQSADALLKLIEEPPPNTVIILTAERPESLLPTIQSRSQKIRLDRVPEAVSVEYLGERYGVDADRAKLLLRMSDGNLGRAIEMAESDEVGEESSQRAVGFLLFKSLVVDKNPPTIAHLIDLLKANDRGETEQLLHLWQSLIRDCLYYASTGDSEYLVNVDFAPEIVKLSRRFSQAQIGPSLVAHIKNTLADLRRNVHIQTALVALSLRLKSDLRASG
jgi:DNA polymerase-3 subunit delta'